MRIMRRFLARVKNFAMGQRSREFGIRIAVGATRGNVMAVVFHQGLRWVTDEITLNWMIGRSTVQQVIRGVVLIHLGVISSRIALSRIARQFFCVRSGSAGVSGHALPCSERRLTIAALANVSKRVARSMQHSISSCSVVFDDFFTRGLLLNGSLTTTAPVFPNSTTKGVCTALFLASARPIDSFVSHCKSLRARGSRGNQRSSGTASIVAFSISI